LATPSPTSCPVMGRQDPRLPRTIRQQVKSLPSAPFPSG
jgi:hypothetical protein